LSDADPLYAGKVDTGLTGLELGGLTERAGECRANGDAAGAWPAHWGSAPVTGGAAGLTDRSAGRPLTGRPGTGTEAGVGTEAEAGGDVDVPAPSEGAGGDDVIGAAGSGGTTVSGGRTGPGVGSVGSDGTAGGGTGSDGTAGGDMREASMPAAGQAAS
jgi:hypothetical protein